MTLPGTAVLGDPGHVTDHNDIVTELTAVIATADAAETPAGAQAKADAAQAAAETASIPAAEKGAALGVAELGADGLVPTAQLPAASTGSVDSVNGEVGVVVLDAADVGAETVAGAQAKADTAEAAAIAAATTDATTKANAAQAAAEAASVPLAEKAAASGVASLDASSKLVQTLDAAKVVSGTFDAARIPTLTAYAPATVTTNTQTGSYTLVLTDAGKVVEQNAAGANNLTVPPNSSVAFPTGTIIVIRQYGAGLTTVVASAGVTIRSRGGALDMGGQYAEATLTKRGTDEWVLSGDIV